VLHALEEGLVEKDHRQEHQDGDEGRQAAEASCCDCFAQGGQGAKKEVIVLNLPPLPFLGEMKTVTEICNDLAVGGFVHWKELADLGWHCLLLAAHSPSVPDPHKRVVLIDGTGNKREDVQEAIAYIVNRWRQGKKVAVMCRSGANRAPAIAAGAMFVSGRATSVWGALGWMHPRRKEIGQYRDTTFEVEMAADAMIDKRIKAEFLE
jgi:protein-tyrosine phosphatase